MSQSTLSRELALRIGLAAKALPDTHPKQLINALIDELGLPLTAEKLEILTLERYRQILQDGYLPSDLKKSLALLQVNRKMASIPLQAYHPNDMPHSIRIAIASSDGIHIDGQFSVCQQFYIYQISAQEQRLIAIRAAGSNPKIKAEHKQTYRAQIIQDCQVLYSQSIGGPAAAKVVKQGVHPIKLNGIALIADIIEQLQHVLSTAPPPWLAKSMGLVKNPLIHSL